MTTHFGLGFSIKKKRAAQGRRSGNHCGRHKSTSRDFRERRDWSLRRRFIFAFYSPLNILLGRGLIVKPLVLKPWTASRDKRKLRPF
jgi:hypothetical protein